ncbi:MAG TPA: AraC family transcriptional regulator [Steroidobacteraceae bacterium]|jgi:AraC-like DNA-binding protein
MLLLRALPRPGDLQRDCDYRRSFYAVWGKVNAILCASETEVAYIPYTQRLSVKACWGGSERYFIDNRTLTVDDDSYLIFNDQRKYSSTIHSARAVRTFSIFFRPGFAEETLGGMLTSQDGILDRETQRRSVEFSEHLRPHDRLVTPVLRYIAFHVEQGVDESQWYEEQLSFLLERMLSSHRLTAQAIESLAASRPGKRQELHRRLSWGRDFIHSNYQRPITIEDMSRAACLSKYHFIRLFHQLEGVTPYRYLQQKRVAAAQRLLATTALTHVEIAEQVGFDHRSTMFRHMRRITGRSGRQWRGRKLATT